MHIRDISIRCGLRQAAVTRPVLNLLIYQAVITALSLHVSHLPSSMLFSQGSLYLQVASSLWVAVD